MSHTVQVPYELFEDEDGVWCANAFFQHGGAQGYGNTRDATERPARSPPFPGADA